MAEHNYLTMSDAEITGLTESVAGDLHACITSDDVTRRLSDGEAVIHRYTQGFAIVLVRKKRSSLVWVLYIDPAYRGSGWGTRIMRELVNQYVDDYYLTLVCHKSLRPFYGRLGFRVESRDGDIRDMIGPFKSGEFRAWQAGAL